jgi:hypothetical protein
MLTCNAVWGPHEGVQGLQVAQFGCSQHLGGGGVQRVGHGRLWQLLGLLGCRGTGGGGGGGGQVLVAQGMSELPLVCLVC